MPKDTFFNLPPEKARRIEESAIEEFMQFTYEAASINRIVVRAEIAKGSFYQYFADKKDLYKHILNRIAEQKMAYLSPVMKNPLSVDFMTLLRELYASGLRFARSHPHLQKIGSQLLADRNNPIYQEFVRENMGKAEDVFQALIRNGIEQGDLRPDIDVQLLAYLIARLNTLMADYYLDHIKQELDDAYMAAVEELIDFICHGISRKGRETE